MKRDIELVLKILEYLEKRDEVSVIKELEIPGHDPRVVAYHCRRMYEAGLLDAEAVVSSTTLTRLIDVLPFGLTWEGHEFLDAMRNDTVAKKVRSRLGGALANVPFTLIKELALAVGRSQLGLS
jgi:Hypothetical protein (DUF2513)